MRVSWAPGKAARNRLKHGVDFADAVIALEMAVRGEYSEEADLSGDHKVTSLDALMILQAAAAD